MKKVIVVDDTSSVLSELKGFLKKDFHVSAVSCPERGVRRIIREKPAAVVTTLVMKDMSGMEVVSQLRSRGYHGPIIMVTRFGNAATAMEAIRCGASDYITLPFSPQELVSRLDRCFTREHMMEEDSFLESLQDGIRTKDPAMLGLLELAHIAADTDSRILILGETGTGKELLARAIHRHSRRVQQPFIVVNCAAIQESLLESELFGHKRGSFTGATENRVGRFEESGEGTLFLDEIGEISLAVQAKLLRVLQSGEYSRVGGNRTFISKARIVAATNQDLEEEVRKGRFRADLFYRLNVVSLTLPPLRERRNDIPLLAQYFLKRFRREDRPEQRFSESAMDAMMAYNWPGNVRELEHLVERSSIMVPSPIIELQNLPDSLRATNQVRKSPTVVPTMPAQAIKYELAKEEFEKNYFRNILSLAGSNYAKAARMAGMDRSNFYRKAKKLLPPNESGEAGS